MKRRYLLVLIICVFVILAFYFIFYQTSPIQNFPNIFPEQQGEENETQPSLNLTFPWSPKELPEGKSGGEGGSGSEGTGTEGGGGGSEPEPPVKHILFIESSPSNLSVFVIYRVDGIMLNITQEAPYSLQTDGDSKACVLAAKLKGSGILKWTIDGEDCIVTECYPPFFGCEVLMDSDHTVTEHWISD